MPKKKSTGTSKYLAKKCEYDGIKFDSKREMNRYVVLNEMYKRREIDNLERQVKYQLIPAQREPSTFNSRGKEVLGKVIERECSYIADFVYTRDGKTVVEDVKGYRRGQAYAVYTIKRKLMLEKYGIRIEEI